MLGLSKRTEQLIEQIFLKHDQLEVRALIEYECANNLPFCGDLDSMQMERIRFAAIKLSEGEENKLLDAIDLANVDWIDLLVGAGFANDATFHEMWVNEFLKSSSLLTSSRAPGSCCAAVLCPGARSE